MTLCSRSRRSRREVFCPRPVLKQGRRPPQGRLPCRVGLLSSRAPPLGSPCRRGLLAADGNYIDLGGPLDLVRSRWNLARLLIHEAFALVVAEDHFVVVHRFQVLGQQWHLSSATRGVDLELRNRETGGP